MSNNFLTQVEGFTPVIDVLAREVGLVTAVVYGVVWRYCQMKDGVCHASIETVAGHIDISPKTARRHIKTLCEHGYLKDTTPNVRNKPHIYADTGKARIVGLVTAQVDLGGGTESPTRWDRESHPGGTESPMKRVVREKRGEGEERPQPPADYLADIAAHSQAGDNAGIATPVDDSELWLQYRDKALAAYKELTGLYPDNAVGKPAISDLAGESGFDLDRWRDSIKSCRLAGVRAVNIACMIDTYRAGGDYRKMLQGDNGDNCEVIVENGRRVKVVK